MVGGELKYGSYRGVGVWASGEVRVEQQMASRISKCVAKFEKIRVGVKLSTLVVEGKSKRERGVCGSRRTTQSGALLQMRGEVRCSGDKERVC